MRHALWNESTTVKSSEWVHESGHWEVFDFR